WWAFSTAQLRMILQQRMKDMGRWEANNRACAQAISEVAESDEDHLLLGQLLIAGGDHELGITLLLKTIRERYIDTAPQGEWALLDLVDATLDQIQAVDSDIRRLQCMERRFRLQSLRGDIPGALALGERLYPLAEAAGAHRIQGSVLMHLANTCYAHGLFVKMEDYARRAVEVTDRYGLNDLAVTPRTNLIFNHARLRNFEEAHRLLRECEQFEEWMTLTQQIQVLIANANISKLQKRYGDEEVLYQQCIVLARADDNPIAECAASNNLAGFYLRRRDPEHAIPLLQRSMAIGERIDYHSGPVAEMYFGHALVLMGQLDQARRILHQAMAVFTRRQNYKRMVDTQTVLLMCATADGDLHEMQRRVDVICGLFDRYNVVGFQYIDWIADRLQEMGLSDQAKPILAPLYE
ncbi:MAG: tetratricopeptide repeat protein, partial [Myxococcota bacterium]